MLQRSLQALILSNTEKKNEAEKMVGSNSGLSSILELRKNTWIVCVGCGAANLVLPPHSQSLSKGSSPLDCI